MFLGKTIAAFLLVFGVELVSLPVFANFYDVRVLPVIFPLIGIIALGTWTMSVVGVFFSLLTINIRLRELMPVIFYPMLIPALLRAIESTTSLLATGQIGKDNEAWVRLLTGCRDHLHLAGRGVDRLYPRHVKKNKESINLGSIGKFAFLEAQLRHSQGPAKGFNLIISWQMKFIGHPSRQVGDGLRLLALRQLGTRQRRLVRFPSERLW